MPNGAAGGCAALGKLRRHRVHTSPWAVPIEGPRAPGNGGGSYPPGPGADGGADGTAGLPVEPARARPLQGAARAQAGGGRGEG